MVIAAVLNLGATLAAAGVAATTHAAHSVAEVTGAPPIVQAATGAADDLAKGAFGIAKESFTKALNGEGGMSLGSALNGIQETIGELRNDVVLAMQGKASGIEAPAHAMQASTGLQVAQVDKEELFGFNPNATGISGIEQVKQFLGENRAAAGSLHA